VRPEVPPHPRQPLTRKSGGRAGKPKKRPPLLAGAELVELGELVVEIHGRYLTRTRGFGDCTVQTHHASVRTSQRKP
jgi:hypothetical protein